MKIKKKHLKALVKVANGHGHTSDLRYAAEHQDNLPIYKAIFAARLALGEDD